MAEPKHMNFLNKFLPPGWHPELLNLKITGVVSDSRQVKPGCVFVAIAGESQDGHEYIDRAIEQGAVLIIGERDLSRSLKVPYLNLHTSGRKILAGLAAEYHGNPSLSLVMVGVTGTSGKTTTSYLIESILKASGHKVGVIGTVNIRYESTVIPSALTTPGPVELQGILQQMKDAGCTAIVMEVSSHALKQARLASIAFDSMVFTNLSPEHLDFHKDM